MLDNTRKQGPNTAMSMIPNLHGCENPTIHEHVMCMENKKEKEKKMKRKSTYGPFLM